MPDDELPMKLYTTAQVAEMFEVGAETIRLWLRSGELEGYNQNSYWRISDQQIREFTQKKYGEVK
jgi:excisionase family DNA binding protein